MSNEVLLAVLAAVVTVFGWFVTYFLSKRREDETRRLEKTVRHLERQIEEFYGPLFNLVHQVVIANHVQHRILSGSPKGQLSEEQANTVRRFFQERYFFPVHAEISQILKTRLYLVEGAAMPQAYYKYLKHSLQEQAQVTLWRDLQVDTSFVPGEPYPNEFYQILKESLDRLMEQYGKYTRALAAEHSRGRIGAPKKLPEQPSKEG